MAGWLDKRGNSDAGQRVTCVVGRVRQKVRGEIAVLGEISGRLKTHPARGGTLRRFDFGREGAAE